VPEGPPPQWPQPLPALQVVGGHGVPHPQRHLVAVLQENKGSIKGDENARSDLMALLVHATLVSNLSFDYLGGENASDQAEKKTKLEEGWNADGSYSMKYRLRGEGYLVKGIPMDDILILNIMSLQKPDNVETIELNMNEYISISNGTKGASDPQKPEDSVLLANIGNLSSAISGVLFPNQKSATTASKSSNQGGNSSRDSRDSDPLRPGFHPSPIGGDRAYHDPQPFSIGRSDLDPFAPSGSGMFADPNHPMFQQGPYPRPQPQVPFGVPPGARYDPITPGGIPVPGYPPQNPNYPYNQNNRRYIPGEPDPDEFAPPGFEFS